MESGGGGFQCWSGFRTRRIYLIPFGIAVVTIVAYLFWLCLNVILVVLNREQTHDPDDSLISLQLVFQSLGYIAILVGEAHIECYPATIIATCVVQFLSGCYLLWGVIQTSEGKLKIWLIYEGLVMGVACLYFVQLLSRPREDNSESESDGMFWTPFIGRVVLFLCFNGFYIYSVNNMREEIVDRVPMTPMTEYSEFSDFGRSSEINSNVYSNKTCMVFISLLNFAFYGLKVLVASIYLVWLAFSDAVSKISIIDSSIYLAIGLLGLIFTYILWQGNKANNSGKIVIYMGFQITTSLFLYGWLIYWTVAGLLFDFVVFKFAMIYLVTYTSIHMASKRAREIGYDDEYRNLQHQEDHEHECDMVQLMDMSTRNN